MAQILSKHARNGRVDSLNAVVAALSVTRGKQSAYGVLYEEEFHRIMFNVQPGDRKEMQLKYLGVHGHQRVRWVPKVDPTVDFARVHVLHFPGNAVTNAKLLHGDEPLRTYFHPLTDSYPTHDSFVLAPASEFFVAVESLSAREHKEVLTFLAHSVVVAGLQLTVSGSDKAEHKPSHSVVGGHLIDTLFEFKTLLRNFDPELTVLEDVVTVFVSPEESCRKMHLMPILEKNRKQLGHKFRQFEGTAVQYSTTFEVPFIRTLMNTKSGPPDDSIP